MKKYVGEVFGTAILVILGCGTAMLVGCNSAQGSGYILTALAFGLAIVACAYSIGNVSGCHVNPAVSIALYATGKLSSKDLVNYIISQVIGAILGSLVLALIFTTGNVTDMTGGFGSNGLGGVGGSALSGLLVEIVLTFIFISAILGVTSKSENHGSFAGLVIGLTLAGVHILGIGLTGTSVNPARSLGPAIINAIFNSNYQALSEVWVFIVAPIIGACLAATFYKKVLKK